MRMKPTVAVIKISDDVRRTTPLLPRLMP